MTTHDWYVAAAYGISTLALAVLVGSILWDQRSLKRQLAEMEASGMRRRSDKTTEATSGAAHPKASA